MKTRNRIISQPFYKWVVLLVAIAGLSYAAGFCIGAEKEHPQTLSNSVHYHAPCLMNLATGQIGELTVYTTDPNSSDKTAEEKDQQSGSMDFSYGAGALIVRDTDKHLCRAQLSAAAGEYVLADLYDPENIQFYPVEDQSTYTIRDYEVFIYGSEEQGLTIEVQGLLFR